MAIKVLLYDNLNQKLIDLILSSGNFEILKYSSIANAKEILSDSSNVISILILNNDYFKIVEFLRLRLKNRLTRVLFITDRALNINLIRDFDITATVTEKFFLKALYEVMNSLDFISFIEFGVRVRTLDLEKEIKEHKRLESELKNYQLQLNKAQEIAHLGSWDWDIQNGTIFWSDEQYRIYKRDKALGPIYEDLLSYIHKDDRESIRSYQTCTFRSS